MKYILSNRRIKREWEFSNNKLFTVSLVDVVSDVEYVRTPILDNDFSYENLTNENLYGYRKNPYSFELIDVKREKVKKDYYRESHEKLTFTLEDSYHGLIIKSINILFRDASAIKTYLLVNTFNMPSWYFYKETVNELDRLPINTKNAKVKGWEFFTRTDHTNFLIEEDNNRLFNKSNFINLDYKDRGVFFLKESPVFSDLSPECYGNFYICDEFVSTLGWGIMSHEFQEKEMQTYSSVVGVYQGTLDNSLLVLKDYQSKCSLLNPMIVANPWGSRSWMKNCSEEFILKEIEAAKELGAEYYQIDDGWNEGYGLIHVGFRKAMDKEFWAIKKDTFPNGFHNIIKRAKELDIKIALWLGLDCNTMYRNWKEQADIIYDFYEKYGICVFKIDIMKLRSYESKENIEKLFKILREKSNGEIVFNLDVTADKRSGYFMFNEYGVVFLENRYTASWATYMPYLTLKNQWDLAKFVPLQNLQIEYLNIDHINYDYPIKELAPDSYSYSYIIGITLFANPLCWFEPSSLKAECMSEYKRVLKVYKEHRDDIQKGSILPIGDRPDGYSNTGFMSFNEKEKYCYINIFRENSNSNEFDFKIDLLKDIEIKKIVYIINDNNGTIKHKSNGMFNVRLDKKKTYILCKIFF